ncbi:helix-turn-helix domain-containing protein, partial [Leuconostoc suionicum]|uniref:helix-turn-helix domain-containing protein n=3 Tax=Leuconostoc suionicum TaxID=1511761 RepID=UPI0032DF79AF
MAEEQDIKFFTQIPSWVDELENISDFQARLIGYIYTFENVTGSAFPSNQRIAKRFGKTQRGVQNSLSDLYKKGIISSQVVYKKDSKEIEKRYLRVNQPHTSKNEGVYIENDIGYTSKLPDPIHRECVDNKSFNKSINRLNNNNEDKSKAYSALVNILEQNGFGTIGGLVSTDINKELDDFAEANNGNYREAYSVILQAIKISVGNGVCKFKYLWNVTRDW